MDLETRTKTLEGFQQRASKDINDLQESLSFTEDKYKTNLANVDKKQENISIKIAAIDEEDRELSAKIKGLETKNLYLEAYSRREKNSKKAVIKRTPNKSFVCLWKPSS